MKTIRLVLVLALAVPVQAKSLVVWCPTEEPGVMVKCQVQKRSIKRRVVKMVGMSMLSAGAGVLIYRWQDSSGRKRWKAIGPAYPTGGLQR